MLILARRMEESIMIGDHIRIKVIEVKGDMVRLGIDAPKDIRVFRSEVYEEVRQQNAKAAKVSADALRSLIGAMKRDQ